MIEFIKFEINRYTSVFFYFSHTHEENTVQATNALMVSMEDIIIVIVIDLLLRGILLVITGDFSFLAQQLQKYT